MNKNNDIHSLQAPFRIETLNCRHKGKILEISPGGILMRRLKIATMLAAFVLGTAGAASAQINNCNNNGFAGTAIGAVVGGTAGGLIANDFRGSRFRRGSFGTGFSQFGSRGGFGFRGNRRGNGAVGAVIGAVVGGVAGSQIAAARQRNCITQSRRQQIASQHAAPSQGYAGAPIDHNARRLGDPYGGQAVVPSQPVGYADPALQPQSHSYPSQTSIVTQPVVRAAEYCTQTGPHTHSEPGVIHQTPTSGSFPITTQHEPIVVEPIISHPSGPGPVTTRSEPLSGGSFPACQILDRRTSLPDGTIVTEPVEYCQFSPGGDWVSS